MRHGQHLLQEEDGEHKQRQALQVKTVRVVELEYRRFGHPAQSPAAPCTQIVAGKHAGKHTAWDLRQVRLWEDGALTYHDGRKVRARAFVRLLLHTVP